MLERIVTKAIGAVCATVGVRAPCRFYCMMFWGYKSGFKKVRVTPYLGKSDRMKGSIPTPYGNIKVAVSKCDGKEKVKISAPLNPKF